MISMQVRLKSTFGVFHAALLLGVQRLKTANSIRPGGLTGRVRAAGTDGRLGVTRYASFDRMLI